MSILAREILGRGSLFGRFESEPIEPLTGYWGTQLVQKAAKYYQVTVSQELVPIVAQRCGGNPFYINVIEIIKALVDKGYIETYKNSDVGLVFDEHFNFIEI